MPRGELQNNSLSIKSWKKHLFIKTIGRLILENCTICFTNEFEQLNSSNCLNEFHIRSCLVPNIPELGAEIKSKTSVNRTRMLYVGRIEQDKNTLTLLQALLSVRRDVSLDIFGPIRNMEYWQKCEAMMSRLPGNIQVRYHGPCDRDMINEQNCNYDVLLNPSYSENYGHTISEALANGLPVICGLHTPWTKLINSGCGIVYENSASDLVKCIETFQKEHYLSETIRRKYLSYPIVEEALSLNKSFIKQISS